MSEWNRRDRDEGQRRYGHEDRNRETYGDRDRWTGGYNDEQRSFDRGQRDDRRNYENYQRAYERYGEPGRGEDDQYGYAQGYDGSQYGRQGGYDERDQEGLAYYGLGPFGSGRHRGDSLRYGAGLDRGSSHGGPSYSARDAGRQDYSSRQRDDQGSGLGHNERLERVADGEGDRHGFFGGGMMRSGEHRGRGPKNYTRSDDRIREDVNDRLSDDSWLDASEIDVAVNACEVTLTGTVNSRDDKRRAEDIVEHVSGVKHVQNNLRVQSQASSQATTSQAMGQGATGASASNTNPTGKSGLQ